jgi:hypothetical protein
LELHQEVLRLNLRQTDHFLNVLILFVAFILLATYYSSYGTLEPMSGYGRFLSGYVIGLGENFISQVSALIKALF